MGLANVLYEWDYPMCRGNGASQCALGMGLANVPWELANQCALGMRLANVPWEWDYQICPGSESIQCTLGMGLSNVPWELNYPMRPGNGTI